MPAQPIMIAPAPSSDAAEADLLTQIKTVSDTQLEANTYPSEGELGGLHARRRAILIPRRLPPPAAGR